MSDSAASVRCPECGCPVGYIHSTRCSKYPEVHKRSAASTPEEWAAASEVGRIRRDADAATDAMLAYANSPDYPEPNFDFRGDDA